MRSRIVKHYNKVITLAEYLSYQRERETVLYMSERYKEITQILLKAEIINVWQPLDDSAERELYSGL